MKSSSLADSHCPSALRSSSKIFSVEDQYCQYWNFLWTPPNTPPNPWPASIFDNSTGLRAESIFSIICQTHTICNIFKIYVILYNHIRCIVWYILYDRNHFVCQQYHYDKNIVIKYYIRTHHHFRFLTKQVYPFCYPWTTRYQCFACNYLFHVLFWPCLARISFFLPDLSLG